MLTPQLLFKKRAVSLLKGRFTHRFCTLVMLLWVVGMSGMSNAQVIALKNNLFYDAAATANLGLEWRLTDHWTMGIGAGLNLWNPVKSADRDKDLPPKWRHVLVNMEFKYWFCSIFARDFIGFNTAYSHYNVATGMYPIGWVNKDLMNYRYQGDMVAAGVFYGWSWILSPHISLELEGGIDGGYAWYDKYDCARCGNKFESERRWFVAPKLGFNFIIQMK